jgi:hypothetical protein
MTRAVLSILRRPLTAIGVVPIYPVVIAVVYVCFVAVLVPEWIEGRGGNIRVPLLLSGAFRPIAAAAALAILLVLLARIVVVNVHQAALVAVGAEALFIREAGDPRWAVVVAIGILIIAIVSRFLHRPVTIGRTVSGFGNLVAVGAASVFVVSAANMGFLVRPTPSMPAACPPIADGPRPNIYVILLDALGRPDTLQTIGIDASTLTTALVERQFWIDPASHTNYPHTEWVLASMLNGVTLQTLDSIVSAKGSLATSRAGLAIDNARFFDLLGCAGYSVVTTDMPIGYARVDRTGHQNDLDLRHGRISNLEVLLLQRTRLLALLDFVAPSFIDDEHRGYLNDALADLRSIAGSSDHPKLVWTHLLSPHLPPLFGPTPPTHSLSFSYYDDNPIIHGSNLASFVAGYETNLRAITERLVPTIDAIIASDPSAIVVVFSDHGPAVGYNDFAPTPETTRLRFANFIAVRNLDLPSPSTPLVLEAAILSAAGIPTAPPDGADGAWIVTPVADRLTFTPVPVPNPAFTSETGS